VRAKDLGGEEETAEAAEGEEETAEMSETIKSESMEVESEDWDWPIHVVAHLSSEFDAILADRLPGHKEAPGDINLRWWFDFFFVPVDKLMKNVSVNLNQML